MISNPSNLRLFLDAFFRANVERTLRGSFSSYSSSSSSNLSFPSWSSSSSSSFNPSARSPPIFFTSRRFGSSSMGMPNAEEVQGRRKNYNDVPEVDLEVKKSYLKSFFRKVHPDYFHSNLQQRKKNEESLQLLNSLLDYNRKIIDLDEAGSSPSSLASLPPLPFSSSKVSLQFFCRSSGEENDSMESSSSFSSFSSETGFKQIDIVKSCLPPSKFRTLSPFLQRLEFDNLLNSILLDLYQQSDILISKQHLTLFQLRSPPSETLTKKQKMEKDKVNSSSLLGQRGLNSREEAEQRKLDRAFSSDNPLWTLEKSMSGKAVDKLQSDVLFSFQNRFIVFSSSLTEWEKEVGLINLQEHLHKLDFASWYDIPIHLIPAGTKPQNCQVKGVVPFPIDFKFKDMKPFLLQNIRRITTERKTIEQQSEDIRKVTLPFFSSCICCLPPLFTAHFSLLTSLCISSI
jgi:hypothetical protein